MSAVVIDPSGKILSRVDPVPDRVHVVLTRYFPTKSNFFAGMVGINPTGTLPEKFDTGNMISPIRFFLHTQRFIIYSYLCR